MFNLSTEPKTIGFVPRSIGIVGDCTIRDVWRQKDITTVGDKERWEVEVAPHGVMLVKLKPGFSKDKPEGSYR